MSDNVKMSEVFDRMRYDALVDLFIDGRPSFDEAEAAAHAIMNHDELVQMSQELLAALEGYMGAVGRMNAAMQDGYNVQGAISELIGYEHMAREAILKTKGAAA